MNIDDLLLSRVNDAWEQAYECDTKARLSFSGEPHAPANMADSRWKK